MTQQTRQKVALVFGVTPKIGEIEQFDVMKSLWDIHIITSKTIAEYLDLTLLIQDFTCIGLADYNDPLVFLPGLENALKDYRLVILKGRSGVYAYQTLKAKRLHKFHLLVLEDTIHPFPYDETERLRVIRNEVTNSADGFLVPSEASQKALVLEGINKDKIYKFSPSVVRSLPANVSREEKSSAREWLGFSPEDFLIYYFGPIEPEEELLSLLHALKYLFLEEPSLRRRVRLLVSGIGSAISDLKMRGVTLGIDSCVKYVLPSRENHLNALKASSSVFISTKTSKNYPEGGDVYRYLMAMVHGLPIIAPRTVVAQETVGKHRLDFCVDSVKSLSLALRKSLYKKSLVLDIVQKNLKKPQDQTSLQKILGNILLSFTHYKNHNDVSLDQNIIDLELLVSQKRYLEAIHAIESLFSKENLTEQQKSTLFRLVGDCFTKLGDQDSGKDSYLKAIDIDPYSSRSYVGLGTVSLCKQNFEVAMIHFQKAISLSPKDETAHLGLGLSFHGLDELDEANKWIVASLDINPENTSAIYSLVLLSEEREDYNDAEKYLALYLSLHPQDNHIRFSLSGIFYRQKKFREVIQLLEEIIAFNPMDDRAQLLLKQARRSMEKNSIYKK